MIPLCDPSEDGLGKVHSTFNTPIPYYRIPRITESFVWQGFFNSAPSSILTASFG